tara:strand:+ start:5832 stop:6719 length:888 start_codon:yes stop_codon:yes gene_type:complete
MKRKGIILAGGTGSRLLPVTKAVSKQLIPVYDKPMIYYPLSTLMLSDIRDILLITTPNDRKIFENLLGDGNKWGISIQYATQPKPDGLVQSFLLAENFLRSQPVALILGDNLFHGQSLVQQLKSATLKEKGATVLAYPVRDPERYGVIEFDSSGKVITIEEKPQKPKSNYAITGLYFYDKTVVERARIVKPSKRGELEITDLNNLYLKDGCLNAEIMSRGMAWLDTGTYDALHEASSYIRTLEHRQGLKVGCPEEVAWRKGWINDAQFEELALPLLKSGYGDYLLEVLHGSSKSL